MSSKSDCYNQRAMFQPWLILLFTFERVIAIAKPLKVKEYCTRKNTSKCLVAAITLICLLCLPISFYSVAWYEVLFDDEINFSIHKSCRITNESCAWIDYFFRCFIPFTLILSGNVIIIHNMKKRMDNRQLISTSIPKAKSDVNDLKNQTCLLLSASFSYLFLRIPYISYILNRLYGGTYNSHNLFDEDPHLIYEHCEECSQESNYVKLDDKGEDHSQYSVHNYLCYIISICFMYINNSINFFLYVLGGKTFRNEFWLMMDCGKND